MGIFIHKPISAFLLGIVALMILLSVAWALYQRFRSKPAPASPKA
jgi:hypothetical protein